MSRYRSHPELKPARAPRLPWDLEVGDGGFRLRWRSPPPWYPAGCSVEVGEGVGFFTGLAFMVLDGPVPRTPFPRHRRASPAPPVDQTRRQPLESPLDTHGTAPAHFSLAGDSEHGGERTAHDQRQQRRCRYARNARMARLSRIGPQDQRGRSRPLSADAVDVAGRSQRRGDSVLREHAVYQHHSRRQAASLPR